MTSAERIRVSVVYAWPQGFDEVSVDVAKGATVADALAMPACTELLVKSNWHADRLAVFGQRVTLATPLYEGDRIELLQPLIADPKQVRRERAGQNKRKR